MKRLFTAVKVHPNDRFYEVFEALKQGCRHDRITWVDVVLDVDRERNKVDMSAGLNQGQTVVGKAESDDMYKAIDLAIDDDRDATRACFALQDHPGIFSRLAGALALVGANVVDARTYTSKDGYATAVFWIQDAEGHPYEAARLPRLREVMAAG